MFFFCDSIKADFQDSGSSFSGVKSSNELAINNFFGTILDLKHKKILKDLKKVKGRLIIKKLRSNKKVEV